jgi:hypothetical protein
LSLIYPDSIQAAQTIIVSGASYTMADIEEGTYVLQASKTDHVTRTYEVTVGSEPLTQNVKLCVYGDVSGDGRINVGDTAKAYSHVRKTAELTDSYAVACTDLSQDGRVNVGDVAKLYGVVRNPVSSKLPAIPASPVEDHKDKPLEFGGRLIITVDAAPKHLVYCNLYRISGTSLSIRSPYAYVIHNGKTYEAVDGVVTVPDLFSDSPNVPVSIAVGNRGDYAQTFTAEFTYPQGHQMNPIPLANGLLSTYCEEGNPQGVYYTFTADKAGTLTIRLTQAVDCNITITSNTVEGGTRSASLSDNPESTSLSFKMSAGETATVCIVMNPVNGFNYPEATVSTNVRFR